MRLLDARAAFEDAGGRYVGGGFSDLNLYRDSDRAEAALLLALFEGYRGHGDALVAFAPRNPESPLFETASDLLLATPETGCLLIEVKSHRLDGIEFGHKGLVVRYGKSEPRTKDPFRQLERRVGDFIRNVDGRTRKRRKGPRIPVGGVVALPRISEAEFHARFFDVPEKPIDHLVFEETLEPALLRERLLAAGTRAAKERGTRLPVPAGNIDVVGEALGEMPRGLRGMAPKSGRLRGSLGEEIDRLRDSNALSPEQRAIAHRTLEGRPTLLRGVAGSGKSILLSFGLVEMLARHADQEGSKSRNARLLVTCFNRTLVPLLRRDIESIAAKRGVDLSLVTLEASHFEGVVRMLRTCWKLRIPSLHDRSGNSISGEDRFGPVLRQIEDLVEKDPDLEEQLWDHVFVDEAQDLDPEALQLLHRVARVDPKSGERGISIFYDDAQNLYGRSRPVWRDLGIHVTGGRTVLLQRSRRTTRPIATFAMNVLVGTCGTSGSAGTRAFAEIETLRDNELVTETDDGIIVEFAQRPGPSPEIIVADDPADEVNEVITRIRDLVRCEGVRPHEILVQSDKGWKALSDFREGLEAANLSVRFVQDDKDRSLFQEGAISMSTIYSAKGYDAPIVFMVNAQAFGTDRESRARFYVGATRAQLHLVVSGYGAADGLLLEASDVRRRLEKLMPGVGW
jgi:hypothetical protein